MKKRVYPVLPPPPAPEPFEEEEPLDKMEQFEASLFKQRAEEYNRSCYQRAVEHFYTYRTLTRLRWLMFGVVVGIVSHIFYIHQGVS